MQRGSRRSELLEMISRYGCTIIRGPKKIGTQNIRIRRCVEGVDEVGEAPEKEVQLARK